MDLSRTPNDKKLNLCKMYFKGKCPQSISKYQFEQYVYCFFTGGFALLPFVWAINFFWFFEEAFKKPPYEEQKAIKKCKLIPMPHPFLMSHLHNIYYSFSDVIASGIGALIWLIVIVSWIVLFQYKRADWGEFADDISFIIPLGRA